MNPWIEAFKNLSPKDWAEMLSMTIFYLAVIILGMEIGGSF